MELKDRYWPFADIKWYCGFEFQLGLPVDHESIKRSTEAILREYGIEVPSHLPGIEQIGEVEPKSSAEIARRALVLSYFIGLAFGASADTLVEKIKRYDLWNSLSPLETKLLSSKSISDEQQAKISLLCESIQAFAWCLNLVEMDNFRHCDDDLASNFPLDAEPRDFISLSKRRPISEIQKQADLLYRLHWYSRQARLTGKSAQVNEGVIENRRRAIDWTYGTAKNWDDISLDT